MPTPPWGSDAVGLRRATLGDKEAIHAVRLAAIRGVRSPNLTLDALEEWTSARSVEHWTDRLLSGQVLVAVWSDALVGWGSSSGSVVTGVYVDPTFGGRGVGRTLLQGLERDILDRGFHTASLGASPNAVAFYVAMGYVPMGPVGPDGELPMQRTLSVAP
jgi:ribosomal protein S18 acetylase RimI-like enzyme